MRHYIKGIRDSNASPYNSAVRLDGVNDYMTLGNSNFYNVGTGEFTFVIGFMPIMYRNPSADESKAIWRKGLSTNVARIVCNFTNLGFLSLILVDPAGNQDSLNIPNTEVPLYKWNTVVVTRKGSNFAPSSNSIQYATSIRNPKNYSIYVNGVSKPFTTNMSNSLGLIYEVDNTEEFIIGNRNNNADAYFNGYIDFFSMYNRALTAEEIADANLGTFPDEGAKGIFDFNQNTIDSSSVGNDMTLLNNSESIFKTFPRKDGIILFTPTDGVNSVKIFTYPEDLLIASLVKMQVSSVSTSLDQVNWTTHPGGGLDVSPLNLLLPANTPFFLRKNNNTTAVQAFALDF
jgi:hypothetical protein